MTRVRWDGAVASRRGALAATAAFLALAGTAAGFGSFKPAHLYNLAGEAYAAAAADLDGDGDADLAATAYDAGEVAILEGKGNGSFEDSVTFDSMGAGPNGIVIGKFNAGAARDLAVTNYVGDNLAIFLGDGSGGFTPNGTLGPLNGAYPVIAGDVDGDGALDLIAGNSDQITGTDAVHLFLGNGNGTFEAALTFDAGGDVYGLGLAKVDGNSRKDLVVANGFDGSVSVLTGDATNQFNQAQTTPVDDEGFGYDALALGDFNGDRRMDAAVPLYYDNKVGVLLGKGDGSFKAPRRSAAGREPNGIQAGDFNRDGDLDLVIANEGPKKMTLLRGKGDGTFKAPALKDGSEEGLFAGAAKLNGDNGLDVIFGSDSGIDVFLNKP